MTSRPHTPLALIVLDGWGLRPDRDANAIALARKPHYDELLERFPHTSVVASGEAVGLPAGQMGNSEVGHMNMGAGRVVYQDLTRIDKSIRDGDIVENAVLSAALDRCRDGRRALHLIGLVSDGGVHSHQRHLHALVEAARRARIERVFVHVLTDGRDSSPAGGIASVGQLEQELARLGTGRLASLGGRYYGMDRDKRWDRTARAYDAIVLGRARAVKSAVAAISESYAAGITDEFIEPVVLVDADGRPVGPIADGDSVLFFNFRADRMRQLTSAIAFREFDGFERAKHPSVPCTTMTLYDATYGLPVVFEPQTFSSSLAEVLAGPGLTSLRLAETEKYAHVTYFFNCGEERPYAGEDRILVPSPNVPTYDLKPDMSAFGVADQFVADVEARRHDVIVCNFANADMVGHTGKLDAAIAAVETLDRCLGRLVQAVRSVHGTVLVTADHGNAEQMWDPVAKAPHTAHTSNPVPVILIADDEPRPLRDGGSLRDVAPTMLGLLEIPVPKEMTGKDLRD
jgi:2,3-bisphosphoglycerate-independent phosphoglycerate mutase